jgi:hypothetical protein
MRLRTLAAVAAKLALAAAIFSQQPHATVKHATPPADAASKTAALPVTSVSLYKNGVGFFEHTGHVSGNAAVTIDFTSAQLNDVLQSLTAIDLNGGRISGADYNSTTPLDQQLRSLSLGLPEKTTFSGFLTAVRGSRVAVSGSGAPFTGRLLDIEMHKTGPGKDANGMLETRFLSVVSDSGELRIFPMTPALSVRLLDQPLHEDVNRYLQLLDSTRNQGLRHLTLEDLGTGPRELHVSYISEVPIWKSTYRILLTDPATTATLQGWSVVDNTTGTDWIDVHLSLIAGAPQSFIQPLSQPIYSRRPEIPIAEEAQLTPQTHDSSIEANEPAVAGVAGMPGQADRFAGGGLEQLSTGPMNGPISLGQGQPGGVMGGVAGYSGAEPRAKMPAPPPPSTYQEEAAESIAPATTTSGFDDFFAYRLSDPITILKNQSALVPILQAKVPAERVTLVSSDGSDVSQPLRALWITNDTNLTLDRGSFSIVENGSFGGEGLLDPIHPGEKRLLSYAADQAVHVSTEAQFNSSRTTRITAAKGVVQLHSALVHEITYVIHNSAPDDRMIVIEHPVEDGYTIDSNPKPDETTATVYRFRVDLDPGKTTKLHVGAKHRAITSYRLTSSDDNQLAFILHQSGDDPTVQSALAPILDARRHVSEAQSLVNQTNARLTALRSDEDRQRANITALQSADKSSRDRFVNDLNHAEDAITAAQTELSTRTTNLDAAKADLANRIESLQLDETVNQK